ncbi:MAG: ATP-binding protein [Actinomycetota bacterium]|nr:ATP-binding protein [Actinomycetota bacterium]
MSSAQSPAPGDRRVRLLVAAVAVLGLLCLLAAIRELTQLPGPQPGQVLVIAAVVLLGDISLLRIRFGAHGNSFTWGEAALVVGAMVGGWPVLITVGTLTVLLHYVVLRRPVRKCLFNAGAFAAGVTLARLTFSVITQQWAARPDADLGVLGILGLAAAAGVYFLWTSIIVAAAVGWSQELPVQQVWAKGGRLRTLMFLGNTTAGIAAVLIGQVSRATLIALPFFLLAVYYVYNNTLRAQLERDRWRELQATTLQLQHTDPRAVTASVQRGAEALFGADVTLMLLSDLPEDAANYPAVLAAGLRARGTVILKSEEELPRLQRELSSLGVVECVIAPLEGTSGPAGALLVGFRGPAHIKRRELQVVADFANHASVSMQRARLFGEIDEQRSRLSAVIDNASDGVVLVGADGVVASWNPGMARLTDRTEESVIGRSLDRAFTGKSADGSDFTVAGALNQLDRLASSDHLTLDVELTMADGSTRDAALSLSAVRAPSGACEYAVLVARDITERREVQRAKQDFIATVSHELRTPLTPIKGFLSLFLRPDFQMDRPQQRVIFGQMLDRANQLERLVEDLLSTSRMEHGEFSLRPEPTDVEAVVERAVEDLASASGRAVSQYSSGRLVHAMCDPARLQQIVANLLSNADKYSPAGKPVVVHVQYDSGEVEIAVQDFGSGIPEDQQGEVFEPFRRLGDHLTRKTRGCGLGLHIARRLVDSMGGRIWLESRVDQGSTFHVTVPAMAEDREEAAGDQGPEPQVRPLTVAS